MSLHLLFGRQALSPSHCPFHSDVKCKQNYEDWPHSEMDALCELLSLEDRLEAVMNEQRAVRP